MTTPKKRGRKPQPFIAANGERINGLRYREHDKRWILADGRTFTEPDERAAIARFRKMVGHYAFSGAIGFGSPLKVSHADLQRVASEMGIEPDELLRVFDESEPAFWARVAKEIRQRPKWVAEQTGIEELAYLTELKPPTPLASFDQLEKTWTIYADVEAEEKRKVLAAWNDFLNATKVQKLADITPEIVIGYRDEVYKRNLGGKTQQHRFNRIRRILTFATSRALAVGNALQHLKILTPNDTTVSLDPDPIEVGDWRKLLDAAEGDDRAMILMMLNCALHLQECVRLEWAQIHGNCLIAHRRKKGKFLRIAVLWPETLEALSAVQRQGDFIFYAITGKPITASGAGKRFRKLRKLANVPHVESDQLRDGAATAAAEANVNDQLFNLLMGHRNPGMKDNYAKRNPQMVLPATTAIYDKYMKR